MPSKKSPFQEGNARLIMAAKDKDGGRQNSKAHRKRLQIQGLTKKKEHGSANGGTGPRSYAKGCKTPGLSETDVADGHQLRPSYSRDLCTHIDGRGRAGLGN